MTNASDPISTAQALGKLEEAVCDGTRPALLSETVNDFGRAARSPDAREESGAGSPTLAGKREIVFDTETTGLDPADGHRLCEIGCVEMINGKETGRYFHRHINPDRPMPSDAQAVHGHSDVFLSDKPHFHEIVEELTAFIGDAQLIAHKAEFDMAFLNAELKICGRPQIVSENVVDTLALARQLHPNRENTLNALCTRYDVDRSIRVNHGALLDARLLAQVYVKLTARRQIDLTLASDPSKVMVQKTTETAVEQLARPPGPHQASAEDHIPQPSQIERVATNAGCMGDDVVRQVIPCPRSRERSPAR